MYHLVRDGGGMYLTGSRTSAVLAVLRRVLFSHYAATGAPGDRVTLRTLVLSGGSPVAGLAVGFAADGIVVGAATSNSAAAARPWTIPGSLSPGVHDVTVSFAGDSTYAPGSRAAAVLMVARRVVLSVFAASGAPGDIVTLRTPVYSGGSPVVGLPVQSSVDGSAAGTATSDAASAALACTVAAGLAPGLHNATVSFAGNSTYAAGSRTAAVLTVK